jgi:hypothetical protein
MASRGRTEYIAATISGAGVLIVPNASHLAFLQDPGLFNYAVLGKGLWACTVGLPSRGWRHHVRWQPRPCPGKSSIFMRRNGVRRV